MTGFQGKLRQAGALTGLAFAVLLVLAFRVPASSGPLGAGVRMTAVPPGELTVPAKSFLSARGLVAGGDAVRGRLRLHNIAPGPVAVRLSARGGTRELDSALRVELRAGARIVHSGSLASLRRPARALRIAEGDSALVRVHARVAADAAGYEGRHADLDLVAHVSRAGRAP